MGSPNLSLSRDISIDLNCDVGESIGDNIVGDDDTLIPLVSSANIACGGHGGDHQHISNAVRLAGRFNVQIGAHPSYPDQANFGRKAIAIADSALRDSLLFQLDYLNEIVAAENCAISYVKPHGAIYHQCAVDPQTAELFLNTVLSFNRQLAIMGQPNTKIESLCRQHKTRFVREGFADRRYLQNGQLKSRNEPGAVIGSVPEVVAQAKSIATKNVAPTDFNHLVQVEAESICVHGDNPQATACLKQIHSAFSAANIAICRFESQNLT
jgi:UPF0271 protein